jgi:hypothetical protein
MATPQTTIPKTIDPCYPSFFGLHHLSHPMGFHSQTFSDISFHTHRPLTSFLSTLQVNKRSSIRVSDAFLLSTHPQFSCTLFGEEPHFLNKAGLKYTYSIEEKPIKISVEESFVAVGGL